MRATEVRPEDATIPFNLACYASDNGCIFSRTNGRNSGTLSLENRPTRPLSSLLFPFATTRANQIP
jgi:hypothetical protein